MTDVAPSGPRASHYDPLGVGMVRPFFRASHGDVCSDQGVNLVLSNLGQILGTAKRTLPWRTDFGSDLERLRHMRNTPALRDVAAVNVRDAFSLWEPRARLKSLDVAKPASVDAMNQVVLDARVAIEGDDGLHPLAVSLRPSLDWSTSESAQNVSLTTGARVLRGMGYLVEPPQKVLVPSFTLSTGLMRPIQRGRDFLSGSGVQEVLSNVGQVLGTAKGTLPWLPAFGSDLNRLRHKPNTPALRAFALLCVDEALGKWEPRARATRLELLVGGKQEQNVLTIRVLVKISLLQEASFHSVDIFVK